MATKKYSTAVTLRFIKLMDHVISTGEASGRGDFIVRVGGIAQNISKIEEGERYPTIEMLCNACVLFNANPAWLLIGQGEMLGGSTNFFGAFPDLSKRLLEIEKMVNNGEIKVRKKAS